MYASSARSTSALNGLKALRAQTSMSGSATTRASSRAIKTITIQNRPKRQQVVSRGIPEEDILNEEYVKLNQEIALLQCELKPLREKVTHLQKAIMSAHGAFIERDESDINSSETIQYSSAMIELNNERETLRSRLKEVREYLSPSGTKHLQKEIAEGAEVCALFVASCEELEKQTEEVRRNISELKNSTLYEDVQAQRKKIVELSESCNNEKQKHLTLKAEMYQMMDPSAQQEESVQNEADRMIKLNRKLDRLRRIQFERSEFYITLREQQMKEINQVSGALVRQTDSVPEVPLLLSSSIPPLHLEDMPDVGRPQIATGIAINDTNRQEEEEEYITPEPVSSMMKNIQQEVENTDEEEEESTADLDNLMNRIHSQMSRLTDV